MALVDADITVEQQSVVVSPANTTASVSIEAVSNQFVISGAPGIRGPKGDIGLTGANVFIGEDPPSEPVNGSLWLRSSTGIRYLWYVDTDGGQWIEDSGAMGPVGPIGPPGPNSIGGAGFEITNLTADDTLIYNGAFWANNPKTNLTGGGNF